MQVSPSYTSNIPVPQVDEALVVYLAACFPMRVQATLDDYRRQEGRQELIGHLRHLLEAQS